MQSAFTSVSTIALVIEIAIVGIMTIVPVMAMMIVTIRMRLIGIISIRIIVI